MPRITSRNPSYRLHKPSGQAVVTLNGEDVYLGQHGSQESRRKYDRVISEWLTRGRQRPGEDASRRVADVVAAYWRFAQGYYTGEAGEGELWSIKGALSILRRAYAQMPARDFGPLALQVVRERMVKEGWSRRYINAQIGRLKRAFKWACSRELIPPSVYHGLAAVDGLRQGKTDARELEPVKPVAEHLIGPVLECVSSQVRAMIELQLASGMRPGEVCRIRTCDIDTTGNVWTYRPPKHKTLHRGHDRIIYLGPKAQEILKLHLKPDLQAFIFSPAEAEAQRREKQHEEAVERGGGREMGEDRKRRPKKEPGERYTTGTFCQAITYGCEAAFPPPEHLARKRVAANGRKEQNCTRWETIKEHKARLIEEKTWAELEKWRDDHRWHPHQLRHNAATRLRKEYGLEAARVVLGHRSAAVAEIYAEIDHAKAKEIMGQVG